MRALREERHKDCQVRKSEEPLVGAQARGLRGARDEAQVPALGKITDVLDANAGQACHFRIGEYFLARFNGNQGRAPKLHSNLLRTTFDAVCIVIAVSKTEQ